LQRYRSHADETVGVALDQLGDSLIVGVAPVLSLLAREPIPERCRMGFEGGHGQFRIRHHFEPLVHCRQLGVQHERRPAGKGERLVTVFFDQLDAEMLAVFLGFIEQTVGHIMMVDIDGTRIHET
jgi:hypothetical protein